MHGLDWTEKSICLKTEIQIDIYHPNIPNSSSDAQCNDLCIPDPTFKYPKMNERWVSITHLAPEIMRPNPNPNAMQKRP
jgi:hypothetical protein